MQLNRKNKILLDTILRLIRRNARATLGNVIRKVHPADIALIMDHLRSSEAKLVFNALESKEISAEVLSEVSYATAAELLQTLEPMLVAEILTEMASDDAAEIIADMPDELTEEVLKLMEDKDSDLVEELLSYSEETAGRMMTPQFLALQGNVKVEDAIREVQKASDAEMVFYVYVVDETMHLLGVISLRQLLTVSPQKVLKEIMIADVIRVRTDQDQEEVARLVARYNLLAVPVVTDRNKLVGIITVDDVVDVISEEATEDMMRMSGASYEDIEADSAAKAFRTRFPWVLTSFVTGFVAFLLLGRYGDLITALPFFAGFIPLVLGIAGNISNQSSTLVARALDEGLIARHRIWSVIFRELRIGLLLGFSYAILTFPITYFLTGSGWLTASALSVTLLSIILVSVFLGSVLPILFQRMKIDPALAPGPISTSVIDIIAVLLYASVIWVFYPAS